jgi:hypothetical protein
MRVRLGLGIVTLALIGGALAHVACHDDAGGLPSLPAAQQSSDDANGSVVAHIPRPVPAGPATPVPVGPTPQQLPLPGAGSPAGPGTGSPAGPGEPSEAGPGDPCEPPCGGTGGPVPTVPPIGPIPTRVPDETPTPTPIGPGPTPTAAPIILTFTSTDVPKNVPLGGSTDSTVTVSGAPIGFEKVRRVRVSFFATWPDPSTLGRVTLFAPLGSGTAGLTLNNGTPRLPSNLGPGFGTGCATGTLIFDSALTSPRIESGSSPYAGSFATEFPSDPLLSSQTNANGVWTLRFVPDFGTSSPVTLHCWTLELHCIP